VLAIMLLSVFVESPACLGLVRSLSSVVTMHSNLRGSGLQPARGLSNSSSKAASRLPAVLLGSSNSMSSGSSSSSSSKPLLLAPLAAQAAAGYSTRSSSSKSSKGRKQAEEAMTKAAVQQLKSMLHVRGIGKVSEKLLRDKGIQSVEDLSGRIISRLEAEATRETTWSPAVQYLQVSVLPA
jgi:hypothetical protein